MKYILANFAQGNASYILCAHLAKQVHDSSDYDVAVIFPLVYGERQKRILKEELGEYTKHVFFDKTFGEILNSIFYSGENFEEHLKKFINNYAELQKKVSEHFQHQITVETFSGEEKQISVSDIICEISRNPQIITPIQPSFYTSFAFYSEILEKSKNHSEIGINKDVLSQAAGLFRNIEESQTLCFIQQPNSFSYEPEKIKRDNEIHVPPFFKIDETKNVDIEQGMYVTVSGIPGLEKFYKNAKDINLKVYSSKKIEGVDCEMKQPNILTDKNILFHFCRAGWGSIAKSIITEKPIITLPYQKGDDPEMFFNNKTLKELNLALFVDENTNVQEFLQKKELINKNYNTIKQDLTNRFSTLNAFEYVYKYICSYLSNQEYIKLKNENLSPNIVKREDKMSELVRHITCKKYTPVVDVMKLINEAPRKGAPAGICLVTDDEGILQGIVTDGDIRRAILAYVPLSYPVEKIMTKNPITVPHNASYLDMLQTVRGGIRSYQKNNRILNSQIQHVIVVDENNKVKNVLNFLDLFRRSEVKTRDVCIIGLGYVGLTLALTLAEEGFHVTGVDLNNDIIELLKQKKSHVHEKGIEELLIKHLDKSFFVNNRIPTDNQDIYVVCVGTPVKENGLDYSALKQSLQEVGKLLKKDDIIILRSTVSVGTCRNKAIPWLEEASGLKIGEDFFLSFAPERTIEGEALKELRTLPQIVGGYNSTSVDIASSFFRSITHQIITVDSLEEAEMVKLINNTYRDVTFAYANELAMVCDKFNINAFGVIRAANEGYSRGNVPFPSPGVGGTCLKKDPHIFCESANSVGYSPKMVSLGRQINEEMVNYVANKVKEFFASKGKTVKDGKTFILGFAFKGKPETSDMRDSTTIEVLELLKKESANIYGYDPIVSKEEINKLGVTACNLEEGFKDSDCVLIMNNHPSYVENNIHNLVNLMNDKALFFDTWNLFSHTKFDPSKINYSTLGLDVRK